VDGKADDAEHADADRRGQPDRHGRCGNDRARDRIGAAVCHDDIGRCGGVRRAFGEEAAEPVEVLGEVLARELVGFIGQQAWRRSSGERGRIERLGRRQRGHIEIGADPRAQILDRADDVDERQHEEEQREQDDGIDRHLASFACSPRPHQ
jgi:hypothetical protein